MTDPVLLIKLERIACAVEAIAAALQPQAREVNVEWSAEKKAEYHDDLARLRKLDRAWDPSA